MAETCAFCGSPGPLTREHVWPSSYAKYLPGGETGEWEYGHERGVPWATERTRWRSRELDVRVKAVCPACNQGWMQQLDRDAESVVAPLIQGQQATLDESAQNLLARWTVKVLMMAEFLHPKEQRHIPPEHRRALFETGALPPDTFIFLAAYRGDQVGWHHHRVFAFKRPGVAGFVHHGYCITFLFGQLAFQAVGWPGAFNEPIVQSVEAASRFPQLWPRETAAILTWPPPLVLNDETLMRFSIDLP